MYFIIKCRDTKCHGTSVENFHTKYHVEPNKVRHWAQQILQVTGSTNAYSGVQAVFLLLFISQVELVKPKVDIQNYLNKTPRRKEYVEQSPLKNTTITPTHLPDMAQPIHPRI